MSCWVVHAIECRMPSRTLRAAVRSSVSADVRSRGDAYFQQGRVSIVDSSDDSLVASVKGSQTYQVTLDLRDEELTVSCTCPYFTDVTAPCKHVWATVLAADEARAFDVPPTVSLTVPEDSEDDLDPDDVTEDLWDDEPITRRTDRSMSAAQRKSITERMKRRWAERAERRLVETTLRARAVRTPPRAPSRPPPPPPAWQVFLEDIGRSPGGVPVAGTLLAGELIYVVDPARSSQAGVLILDVMTRERKKNGEWAKPKAAHLTTWRLTQLPDGRDREILEVASGASSVQFRDDRKH